MRIQITIVSLTCIALVSFTGDNNKHKTGWDEEQLKGRVKSYRILSYNTTIKDGKIVKGDTLIYQNYYLFDKNGNEVENGGGSPNEPDNSKEFRRFNDKGQCVESRIYEFHGKDTTSAYTDTRRYDDNGNEIESTESRVAMSGTLSIERTIYKYDGNGNLIQWNAIDGKDTSVPGCIYKYDGRGNKIEEDYMNSSNGKLMSRNTNVYNDKNETVETDQYGPDERLLKRTEFKYDSYGNVVNYTAYNGKGIIVVNGEFKIEYDKVGNRVSQIDIQNGNPVGFTEYEIVYY